MVKKKIPGCQERKKRAEKIKIAAKLTSPIANFFRSTTEPESQSAAASVCVDRLDHASSPRLSNDELASSNASEDDVPHAKVSRRIATATTC